VNGVRRWFVPLLLSAAFAAGCRAGADTPLGVAERFVDEHYVRIDLAAAKQYCVGLAREKIEKEQKLVGDQKIDASTRQPRVSYRLQRKRDEGGDRFSFVFEGDIRPDGADAFSRRWLVSTRRQPSGHWKVSNFEEFD
jgi:hypothetical protein